MQKVKDFQKSPWQSIKSWAHDFRRKPSFMGFALFIVAILLHMLVQGPGNFFSEKNINTLFVTQIPFLLVVLAQGVLLISGTLDVSVGIQLALVNVVTIMTIQEWGVPFIIGALFGIIASLIASTVCWLLVSVFRLPTLLASFSLISVILGVNVLIMDVPQGRIPMEIFHAYDTMLFGFFPVAAFALIFVMLIWLFIKRTSFGTNIYAVGASPQHAFAAGISPVKVQFQAFMFKGFVAGIAGICLTMMTASGNPLQAEALGLRSLAACIVGGLTFGGWGSMACALFGGSFMILVQTLMHPFFNQLQQMFPEIMIATYWHNLLSDVIVFLGLLLSIVTIKGQREALRISVKDKYTLKRREEYAK